MTFEADLAGNFPAFFEVNAVIPDDRFQIPVSVKSE